MGNSLEILQNVPLIVTFNTVDFLLEFAGWYRKKFNIPVVGITGSTGKTTVKEMIAAVLEERFKVMKTQGNQNNFIGVSLTLLNLTSSTELAVIEMGTNHPGEIARLTRAVKPTHAAISNIGRGHIGFFRSLEAIFQEKKSLPDGLSEGGVFFRNIDDEFLKKYHRKDIQIVDFGLNKNARYRANFLGADEFGRVRFRVNDGPEIYLKIPGKHHMINALLAAAVGSELGIEPEQIRNGLESVEPPDKRMEFFKKAGVLFINDSYNANPESLKAAIDLLCEIPLENEKKRYLVVGDMLELGELSESLHREIGKYLLNCPVDFVFGYGQYSRFICQEIEDSTTNRIQTRWFTRHEDIAYVLEKQLKPGDIVLLKGSRGMAVENVLTHLNLKG